MSDTFVQESDTNKDGVPDRFQQVLNDERFGPNNWEHRRRVIHRYLWLCGTLITLIVVSFLAVMGLSVWKGQPIAIDQHVTDVLSTALFVLVTFAGSMIASYVFGAQMDSNSFRNTVSSMLQARTVGYQGQYPGMNPVGYNNAGYPGAGYPSYPTNYGGVPSYPNNYQSAEYTPATVPPMPPIAGG